MSNQFQTGPFNPTFPALYPNFPSLQGAIASANGSSSVVVTEGFNAPGDGGEAIYIKAGGSTPGGFQDGGGQWWSLSPNQIILPQMFGAKCDGATDDTSAITNAQSFCSTNGMPLWFLSGTCFINSNFTFTIPCRFVGGSVAPGANMTLTFNCEVEAPLRAIFNLGASNSVVAGSLITRGRGIPPHWFGAKGDNVTDDSTAFQKWYVFVKQSNAPGWLPESIYKCNTAIFWDMASVASFGISIIGEGVQKSILNLQGVATSPCLFIFGSGGTPGSPVSLNYGKFVGFGVQTNINNLGIQFGTSNFADALNEFEVEIQTQNFNAGTSAVGMAFNYFLNGVVWAVSDTGGAGTGIQYNQLNFTTVYGSVSAVNGTGIVMGGGSNAGNVFIGIDNENVTTCLSIPNGTVLANTFIGGTWNFNGHGINAAVGSNNLIVNPNLNPSGAATAANFIQTGTGITTQNGNGISSLPSQPGFPATGATYTNTTGFEVQVLVYGGTITQVILNGFTTLLTGGTFVLKANDTIKFTYTGTPSWYLSPI